jgi:hypothetical protein
MYTPLQSRRVRGSAGEPLPVVFKAFKEAGIEPRRGQFALACAGPGTGKSATWLRYCMLAGLPALIFSADSDAFDQLTRMISMALGWPMSKSKRMVLAKPTDSDYDPEAVAEYEEALGGMPIRFNYDPAPTLDTIENSVAAYAEVYGEFPSIIVVDNVTNVVLEGESGEDAEGLEGLMEYLHTMARDTEAFVLGLHHVKAEYNNGDRPIPLNGIKNQISRIPQLIMTAYKKPGFDDESKIIVWSPVKSRSGQPDQTGETGAELAFVGSTMTICDVGDLQYDAWPDAYDGEEEAAEDTRARMEEEAPADIWT